MKLAILGAMEEEIALIREQLQQTTTQQLAHLTLYHGQYQQHEICLVKCGIGKVAAAVAATLIIQQFQPEAVINTGSAGGFDTQLNIGDIVIADQVIHHDVDLTVFGYEHGQCAAMPASFPCDPKWITKAKQAVSEITQIQHRIGTICTGDSFVGTDDAAAKIRSAFPDVKATEMEGAAIGQNCFMLNTPFIVIRSLSDIAGKTSKTSFEDYLKQAAKHSAQLVLAMCQYMER
jgi:adenosylhomocysteine nucleosidase